MSFAAICVRPRNRCTVSAIHVPKDSAAPSLRACGSKSARLRDGGCPPAAQGIESAPQKILSFGDTVTSIRVREATR
jgi:hypothetical protein